MSMVFLNNEYQIPGGVLLFNGSGCTDVNQAQNVLYRNKDELAKTLRQNWTTQVSDIRRTNLMNYNDDLTNLGWLQNSNLINLKINSTAAPLSPPVSPIHNSKFGLAKEKFSEKSNFMLRRAQSFDLSAANYHQQTTFFVDEDNVRSSQQSFKADLKCQPSYSIATLIWMCISDHPQNKVGLTDIYTWIMKKFDYYRHADPNWKNLVRHELSTNKSFQKVVGRGNESGHRRYWCLNQDYQEFVGKKDIDETSLAGECVTKVSSSNKRKRTEPTLNKSAKHRFMGLQHSKSCIEYELPSINTAFDLNKKDHSFDFHDTTSTLLNDDDPNSYQANELAFNYLFNGSELDAEHSTLSSSKDRCMLAASLSYNTPSPSSDGVFEDLISGTESESLTPPLDGDALALDLTVYGQGLSTNWCNNESVSAKQAINLNGSFGYKFSQSPLFLDEDEDWINTQLGLEGLDSILELDSPI